MKVLLTGGAGYIGSHTAVELLNAGHGVIIADNFSNSKPVVIDRIGAITKIKPIVYNIDIQNYTSLDKVFSESSIDSVIHFAGYKSVSESIMNPLIYYRNNIDTTLTLLQCMRKHNVNNIVFSSSATVYGKSTDIPFEEKIGRGNCTNPYGWTKYMIEQILEDIAYIDENFSAVILRYFNPVGAHESGLIGEDPQGIPNNLMPYITQVAIGKRSHLTVYGGDYNTPDGTCRRDFIHVMDLANAHLKAIEYTSNHKGLDIFNVGTGVPYSVLDIIQAFQKINGVKIMYKIGPRRSGDLPECWANVEKAFNMLGWMAKRDLSAMCRDAWNWQKINPNGYCK